MGSCPIVAVAFGAAMLAATAASGQQDTDGPELHAGRPGITESAGVAGRRVIQFEGGIEFDASPESHAWSESFLTPAVLRVGLTSRFELRVAGNGLTVDRAPAAHDSGMADLTVGAKYILLDAESAGFELAIIPALGLPTGSDSVSSHHYQPSLFLSFARDLPAGFDLGASLGFTWPHDPAERRATRAASVAIGHPVAGSWSCYGEVAAADSEADVDWLIDGGVSRTIGRDAQIDFEVGHRISGHGPDWVVGGGLVIRHVGGRRKKG